MADKMTSNHSQQIKQNQTTVLNNRGREQTHSANFINSLSPGFAFCASEPELFPFLC